MTMPLRSLCLAALAAVTEADCSTTCRRGQPCWPTSQEVQELHDALDPDATRSLHYKRLAGLPKPGPTPFGCSEPLCGSNHNLEPLYELSYDASWNCHDKKFTCHQAIRDCPLKSEQPAFVAWPLNVDHVQKLLRFATAHNLGISVAGTGHDFLNRHSCQQGIFIRMSLMKDIEWRLNGTDGGSVRLGPGVNFGEIMYSGKDQQPPSYTMAGWIGTVGPVGWSLGGGHGPFGRSRGFGTENLLELEVVTADGELVTASDVSHPDLFWAMRGGGGSTWGVVTGLTLKAYASPPSGVSVALVEAFGNGCDKGLQGFEAVAHGWANWTADLGHRFSGIFDTTVSPVSIASSSIARTVFGSAAEEQANEKYHNDLQRCGMWAHSMLYVFEGAHDDEELHAELKRLKASFGPTPGILGHWHVTPPIVIGLSHWWEYIKLTRVLDLINDEPARPPAENATFDGWLASIAVDGEARELMASKFGSMAKELITQRRGGNFQVYHDIPGEACPVRPAPNATALGRAFRDAEFHVILMDSMNEQNRDWWNELGSGAYFGESAYIMDDWKEQYWGDHYDRLLAVKRRYDPTNLFWCHNCVGSDLPRPSAIQV